LPAGKIPYDVVSSVLSQLFSEVLIRGQLLDCPHQGRRILRLDHDSGLGVLDDLAGLAIDSENYRARSGHEFEHLGRDHRLENIGLLQQNKTGIGRGDEGGDFFSRLLIEEANVCDPARLR
jgi:hypothetical protein